MTGFSCRGRWLVALALICLVAGCTSCGGGGSSITTPPAARPSFDRTRAFADLEAQVAFGPRSPGSDGHLHCLDWLTAQLRPLADSTVLQTFTTTTPLGGPHEFTNVIAVFGAGQPGEVWMLGAHWDTRPVADQDPDPANRDKPILGANDGASGVAILLEIARGLKQTPPSHPVLLAFFDAEDSGTVSSALPYYGFCIGSRYLATHWPAGVAPPAKTVVIDLVGGTAKHDVRLGTPNGSNDVFDLPQEVNSLRQAPALVSQVWGAAQRLGHTAFQRRTGLSLDDDHMPFLASGRRAIDVVDFPVPVWHTIDDTPEYCSPDALYQVGDSLIEVLYRG